HEVDPAAVGRELERLAHPLVVVDELLHVQRGGGHALTQRLDDRVAADDQLGGGAAAAALRGAARGAARLGLGGALLGVALAHLGGRRGALAFEAPAPLAATADLRALLAGHAAVVRGHEVLGSVKSCGGRGGRVRRLRLCGCVCAVASVRCAARAGRHTVRVAPVRPQRGPRLQRGPCGLSSMTRPDWLSWSRMASAVGQSLRAPAASRWSRTMRTRVSTTPCRSSPRSPSPAQCGSSGSRPSTPSMARTSARRATAASLSSAASALLPCRTVVCTTASACGTPRSSSIASAKAGGTSADGSTVPAFSTTRCTKPSIRANADSASRSASSLYSIIER